MASLNIRLVITDERSESRENTQNGEGKGDSQQRRLNYSLLIEGVLESKENGAEAISEEIMVKNFPQTVKETKSKFKKLGTMQSRIYTKKIKLRHITV